MNNNLSNEEDKYLTFWIEDQLYGVPISDVVRIVGIQPITEIPDYPSYANGIINLMGSIIPVIDVRMRMNKMSKDYDERTCIIITNIIASQLGFIVDSVDATMDINRSVISAPPSLNTFNADSFISGVAKLDSKVVLLLDTHKLLGDI